MVETKKKLLKWNQKAYCDILGNYNLFCLNEYTYLNKLHNTNATAISLQNLTVVEKVGSSFDRLSESITADREAIVAGVVSPLKLQNNHQSIARFLDLANSREN